MIEKFEDTMSYCRATKQIIASSNDDEDEEMSETMDCVESSDEGVLCICRRTKSSRVTGPCAYIAVARMHDVVCPLPATRGIVCACLFETRLSPACGDCGVPCASPQVGEMKCGSRRRSGRPVAVERSRPRPEPAAASRVSVVVLWSSAMAARR